MHASDRAPQGPWVRTVGVALILASSTLLGLELFWRSQGIPPSIADNADLWAIERDRVTEENAQAIALLGASRMQLGVSIDTVHARYPGWQVGNLAVNGQEPMATLLDLAEDESFHGVVICSVAEHAFERPFRKAQARFVRHYHKRATLDRKLNARLRQEIQQRATVANPNVGLSRILFASLRERALPEVKSYVRQRPRRSVDADYQGMRFLTEHRDERVRRARQWYKQRDNPEPQEWLAQALELEQAVNSIQSRGGRVVYVRFPTTGPHWQMDMEHYPREEYWDRLAERSAATMIHFKDVPSLSQYECPDTSHIDYRDKPAFTGDLLDALAARGVLPRPRATR